MYNQQGAKHQRSYDGRHQNQGAKWTQIYLRKLIKAEAEKAEASAGEEVVLVIAWITC
jgi:hypothetical protein